jgi:hypothetical protein
MNINFDLSEEEIEELTDFFLREIHVADDLHVTYNKKHLEGLLVYGKGLLEEILHSIENRVYVQMGWGLDEVLNDKIIVRHNVEELTRAICMFEKAEAVFFTDTEQQRQLFYYNYN